MRHGRQESATFLNIFNNDIRYFDLTNDDGGHTMTQPITLILCLLKSTTTAFIKRFVDDIQKKLPLKSSDLASRLATFELSDKICVNISYYTDSYSLIYCKCHYGITSRTLDTVAINYHRH